MSEDPAGLPYHRLFRGLTGYRWWRPLVALVLLAVFMVVGGLVVGLVVVFAGFALGEIELATLEEDIAGLAVLDTASPLALLFSLGSIAAWLPAVPLAVRAAGLAPAGVLSSVRFRLRGRWLAACGIPAAATVAASLLVSVLVLPALGGAALSPVAVDPARMVLSLAIILLLVPVQSAAEEYVFRGAVTQILGAWIRWTPVVLVLPTVLFALGHPYEPWGLIEVATFGIGAAVVTWRTGGLEAAIVLHVLNNVGALGLLATGVLGDSSVQADGGGPATIGLTAAMTAVYVLWVDRLAARHGLERLAPTAPASRPDSMERGGAG